VETARKRRFAHLAAAEAQILAWARSHDVPLVHVDFVVPFVETDFGVSVWLFYDTNASVARLKRDRGSDLVRATFLELLTADGYPPGWLAGVRFHIDSHENVVRNYKGSYFYRLR
jgi:hypothetical protein